MRRFIVQSMSEYSVTEQVLSWLNSEKNIFASLIGLYKNNGAVLCDGNYFLAEGVMYP